MSGVNQSFVEHPVGNCRGVSLRLQKADILHLTHSCGARHVTAQIILRWDDVILKRESICREFLSCVNAEKNDVSHTGRFIKGESFIIEIMDF